MIEITDQDKAKLIADVGKTIEETKTAIMRTQAGAKDKLQEIKTDNLHITADFTAKKKQAFQVNAIIQ